MSDAGYPLRSASSVALAEELVFFVVTLIVAALVPLLLLQARRKGKIDKQIATGIMLNRKGFDEVCNCPAARSSLVSFCCLA